MKKDTAFKRLLHKLRIPYRLVIMNDSTFEEKFSLKLSRLNVFVVITIVTLVLIIGTVFLIAFTPLREYIPGYGSVEDRQMVYKLSLKTDSLEKELSARQVYFDNLIGVLSSADSTLITESRASYASGEPHGGITANSDATGLYFLPPVKGQIIKRYSTTAKHFAIDFGAPKGSIISSVGDGMVVFADWTLSGGNTIIILHPGKVVSVYMHNLSVSVKQGQTIKAGDPIAIIGNSGENTTGPHLHFELWIDLQPVNPENYISL